MGVAARPRVRFLTSIWGEWYIENFASLALPSFLAPGNLPALAAATDLEVLIMTAASDVPLFRRQPAFRRLESICPVRFIPIDDLISTSVYGVTLTLAFARGVMDSGEQQTDTFFVFMNADFVLADGSLCSLARKILDGHRCIVAPSLRAASEPLEPVLIQAVDRRRHELIMQPRTLVALALDNLHPTTVGKTVTQDFVHCDTVNQLYWRVDERTLLGRYHLIFMLCIRPERPLGPVNSYCDYGLVPEMTPSGRFVTMQDSDEFFMLELQRVDQEKELMQLGPITRQQAALSLAYWITPEHRRFAQVNLVFHSGDLPDSIDRFKQEAALFIADVQARMPNPPVSHVYHHYWVNGVRTWLRANRKIRRVANLPRELDRGTLAAASAPPNTENGAQHAPSPTERFSTMPSIWRHDWLDHRLLRQWLAQTAPGPDVSTLVVGPATSDLPEYLVADGTITAINRRDLISADQPSPPEHQRYRRALCMMDRDDLHLVPDVLDAVEPLLSDDAEIGLFIVGLQSQTSRRNFLSQLSAQICTHLPTYLLKFELSARYVGGRRKRKLRRLELRLRSWAQRAGAAQMWRAPLAWLAGKAVSGLIGWNNRRSTEPATTSPPYCSSALLIFRRRPSRTDRAALQTDETSIRETAVNA